MNPVIFLLYLIAAFLALTIEWPWMRTENGQTITITEHMYPVFNVSIVSDGVYSGNATITILNVPQMTDLLLEPHELCTGLWAQRDKIWNDYGIDLNCTKMVQLYHISDTMSSTVPLLWCKFAV